MSAWFGNVGVVTEIQGRGVSKKYEKKRIQKKIRGVSKKYEKKKNPKKS